MNNKKTHRRLGRRKMCKLLISLHGVKGASLRIVGGQFRMEKSIDVNQVKCT